VADRVIGLFGPTASGKSDVAAAITELLPAEVVSADAMQVYEGLPILTNRSSHPERLVGIWPLSHPGSVGEYAPLAHAAVEEILAGGRTPLVVGGTGLYFRAALAELELPPAPEDGARERWSRLYDEKGAGVAHERLGELDSAVAARVHPNDRRRVVRALELAEAGHSLVPYAAYQRKWLRRLEGLVIVAADRPPEETAAEIVALARTRERLSRP
jgi:tRNA dimethylallyltransferase